jgi:hypothetical protein
MLKNTASGLVSLTDAEAYQLAKYLVDDPQDVTSGIPDVLVQASAEVLDIFSNIRLPIPLEHYDEFIKPFVAHVFEKFLGAILKRDFHITDPDVLWAGIEAWMYALYDLESRDRDDITDEARESLPDWDNGMISCAIIKACSKKFIKSTQTVPA